MRSESSQPQQCPVKQSDERQESDSQSHPRLPIQATTPHCHLISGSFTKNKELFVISFHFLLILSLKYSLHTCQFAMLKTPIYRSNPSAFTASHLFIPRLPIILPQKNLATNRTLSINLSKQAQVRSRRNDPQKFE